MTVALQKIVEAMIAELDRQCVSIEPDAEVFHIQGMVDLEKVARAGLETMHYTDADKPAFIATADRHEIRPLVLISAYDELLARVVAEGGKAP